jgi:hypothetical protein
MRGLIAATALLVGAQAAIDPIVIKVCGGAGGTVPHG